MRESPCGSGFSRDGLGLVRAKASRLKPLPQGALYKSGAFDVPFGLDSRKIYRHVRLYRLSHEAPVLLDKHLEFPTLGKSYPAAIFGQFGYQ